MLAPVRILVAITGASGAIYTQRLLDRLDPAAHEIHVITSSYANIVLKEELPDGLRLAEAVQLHAAKWPEYLLRYSHLIPPDSPTEDSHSVPRA